VTGACDEQLEYDTCGRGKVVAMILAGSWRRHPPQIVLTAPALEAAVPLFAAGGAGGLAWHRLRDFLRAPGGSRQTCETASRLTRDRLQTGLGLPCRELQQHHRLQTLAGIHHEAAVQELVQRLRVVGVEPILIKGWSLARLYPERGLRPSSDVDLCVPADQITAALAALSGPLPCQVDLHADISDLPDRSWSSLLRRSQLVPLGRSDVRIPGWEDHLRLLCLHLARHGISRPLWLCDVAVCLEALPTHFDWDLFQWGNRQHTSWARCVIGLARRLLGAASTLPTPPTLDVPPWIEQAVCWSWGGGPRIPLDQYVRRPGEITARLRFHGIGLNRSTRIAAAFDVGCEPRQSMPPGVVRLLRFVFRKLPRLVRRLLRPRLRLPFPLTLHGS
jgi:hypothetical protein